MGSEETGVTDMVYILNQKEQAELVFDVKPTDYAISKEISRGINAVYWLRNDGEPVEGMDYVDPEGFIQHNAVCTSDHIGIRPVIVLDLFHDSEN